MWCPRLEHFVRFNANGTVSRCGHMNNAAQFNSLAEMESSNWLATIKEQFNQNVWPVECKRCEQTEKINGSSIRLTSIELDQEETTTDYLQVGGVLDNICNAACQFCNSNVSTKIGRLKPSKYIKVDNSYKYWNLPHEQIVHLDINGGEPTASKNYKKILENLPPNLKTLRLNTNCAILLPELQEINDRGIEVTVTVSFDGVGRVHDYVRWPIKWDKFYKNLMIYKEYKIHDLNLWSTINTLNINDFNNIINFVKTHNFNHSYALLNSPLPLNVKFKNQYTLRAKELLLLSNDPTIVHLAHQIATDQDNEQELTNFINEQDQLRNIKISNFIN